MNDLATIQRMNNAIESAKQRRLAKAMNDKRAAHVKRAADTITRAEKTRTGAK